MNTHKCIISSLVCLCVCAGNEGGGVARPHLSDTSKRLLTELATVASLKKRVGKTLILFVVFNFWNSKKKKTATFFISFGGCTGRKGCAVLESCEPPIARSNFQSHFKTLSLPTLPLSQHFNGCESRWFAA